MNFTTTKDNVETKIREAFNFTVDKFPLSGPEQMRTPWYGLFRSDTMEAVGSGSKSTRYVPHQTDDVVALASAAGQAFDGEFEVKCQFRNGHRVIIQPTGGDRLAVFGTKDNVFPRVIINAGYSGRAFSATLGYYRDLCCNLAEIKRVKGSTVSIRHTSSLHGKMDELIRTFSTLKESWVSIEKVIMQMASKTVNLEDFLNEIYPLPSKPTGRAATMHETRRAKISGRVLDEAMRSGRSAGRTTAWEAYNAVQGYVQHDATVRAPFNSPMDRIVRASRNAAVRQALSLAISMSA